MPIDKYFEGHGEEVMKSMKEQYGKEKGEQVFYAKANKQKEHHSANNGSFLDSRICKYCKD